MARVPSYQKTTALVARALALTPETLVAGFVPATQLELAQILELRKQVIGADLVWDDSRYLNWRYHLGSADRGRGECWIVKRGDEVLAMLGSERVSVVHQERAVDGVLAMDIAVRPDLSGVGLGVWMAMHLCEQSNCVLAIGSNQHSRSIVSRVFARQPDRRCYAHLIESRPTLQRRWKHRWIALVGGGLANWMMKVWRGYLRLFRDRSIRIEPLLRFDSSVDGLIAQSQPRRGIAVSPNAQSLNWRLFDNPRSTYSVWAARDVVALVGYIAVRLTPADDGSKSLAIQDMLVRAGEHGAATLRVLLLKVFDQALAEGCTRISVIACHPDNERVLRRLGFMAQPGRIESLSVQCRDLELKAAITAGAPWYLTGANTDRDD